MRLSREITCLALFAAFVYCPAALAQQRNLWRPGSAQGQLTVSLTVVPSVGVVFDENGAPRLIEANTVSPSDNVSRLQVAPDAIIKRTLENPVSQSGKKKRKK